MRDVTRQLLFGGDENRNHRLEPGEQQRLTVDALAPTATEALPWTALVTVYSAERLTTADGRPRINLNDADLARLHGALLETLGQPLADFTVLLRQHGPHSGGQELATNESVPVDLTVPPRYALASPLDLVGAAVNLGQRGDQAGVPLVVSSPLSDEPARLAEDLPRLMDLTCVDAQTVAYGRINIDLAPRSTLGRAGGRRCCCRTDPRRRGDSGGDPARRHPTWLLAEGIIDLPTMRSLAPYLTCGGDVYRAQIDRLRRSAGPERARRAGCRCYPQSAAASILEGSAALGACLYSARIGSGDRGPVGSIRSRARLVPAARPLPCPVFSLSTGTSARPVTCSPRRRAAV